MPSQPTSAPTQPRPMKKKIGSSTAEHPLGDEDETAGARESHAPTVSLSPGQPATQSSRIASITSSSSGDGDSDAAAGPSLVSTSAEPSAATSTRTTSPSRTPPERIAIARRSWISDWMSRRSGRAPNTGS